MTPGHGLIERAGAADPREAPERLLPVLPALASLLPAGALRRGTTVAVQGSAALLLALLAGPSQAGSWCAVVGMPILGLVAAAETGVALDRLALVPVPGTDWPSVVAALLDAFDVVVVVPRGRVRDGEARRLGARARQRGAVLVAYGGWDGAELRLSVESSRWVGLGSGHGHLRARQVAVRAEGRGAASRARRAMLWLPAPGGGVVEIPPALAPVVPLAPAAPERGRPERPPVPESR